MGQATVGSSLTEAFARDGVVCVRQVLDAAEVAQAAAAIEAVLANPSPLAQIASQADDPGAFTEDFRRWQQVPAIEHLAKHSRVPAIAAALMATEQVRFYHDHVLVKEGGTRQRTPWHQDQPYYNVDGPGVSAWIPVDQVPEAGCLEIVGRHSSRTLADAAHVHAPRGEVVPRGKPGRDPRHRGRPGRLRHPAVRTRSR